MKFKKAFSALVATTLITSGSVAMNAISLFTPLTQTASASTNYCKGRPFTAKALFRVNVRADRSTSSGVVKVLNPGTYTFSTWEQGQFVNDYWTGKPDNMWYKLADGSGWVASAVISGYPPTTGCPITPPLGGNVKAENFFRWANGQRGIARLDRGDLRGQCVTLAVRYLQEVYFTGSDKTRPRAYGHGKDVAAGIARQHPNLFQPFTRNGLPKRGAIISYPGPNTQWGHVGIVMEARYSGSIRQIRMLESNWDSRNENSTVRIGGWVNIDGWNAYRGTNGWTNPR